MKAAHGFINLKMGEYLVYTPWDTLPLALVEEGADGPVFRAVNKISDAVYAPCE